MVGWLELNVPFQHKYGYIRDECRHVRAHLRNLIIRMNRPSAAVMWPYVKLLSSCLAFSSTKSHLVTELRPDQSVPRPSSDGVARTWG